MADRRKTSRVPRGSRPDRPRARSFLTGLAIGGGPSSIVLVLAIALSGGDAEQVVPATPAPAAESPSPPADAPESPELPERTAAEWKRSHDAAMAARDRAAALRYIDRALAVDPDNVDFLLARAGVLAETFDHARALADIARIEQLYRKGVDDERTLVGALQAKSSLLALALDFAGAERVARRYVSLASSHPWASFTLANVLRIAGDLDGAIAAYRQCGQSPFFFNNSADLGLALLEAGRRDEALKAFEEARWRSPPDRIFRRCAAACRAWAMIHPGYPGPPDVAGARYLLTAEGPVDETLVEREPYRSMYILFPYAVLRELEGDSATAYRVFRRYGSREWMNYPETGWYFARAARALGHRDEAEAIAALARRVRPGLASIYER